MKKISKKDKELLLKDLCARLPYGVICHYNCVIRCDTMEIHKTNCVGKLEGIIPVNGHIGFMVGSDRVNALFDDIKPYLRPMSSMTDEEKKKLGRISCEGNIEHKYGIFYRSQDYLNSIHVDYRGLIPMGLALEAHKGLYN